MPTRADYRAKLSYLQEIQRQAERRSAEASNGSVPSHSPEGQEPEETRSSLAVIPWIMGSLIVFIFVGLIYLLVSCGGTQQGSLSIVHKPDGSWGVSAGVDVGWARVTYNEHGLKGCILVPFEICGSLPDPVIDLSSDPSSIKRGRRPGYPDPNRAPDNLQREASTWYLKGEASQKEAGGNRAEGATLIREDAASCDGDALNVGGVRVLSNLVALDNHAGPHEDPAIRQLKVIGSGYRQAGWARHDVGHIVGIGALQDLGNGANEVASVELDGHGLVDDVTEHADGRPVDGLVDPFDGGQAGDLLGGGIGFDRRRMDGGEQAHRQGQAEHELHRSLLGATCFWALSGSWYESMLAPCVQTDNDGRPT